MVLLCLCNHIYGGLIVYKIHFFNALVPDLHHFCTKYEAGKGDLSMNTAHNIFIVDD
jgi:hypothetical protein